MASLYDLADQALDGELAQLLQSMRDRGLSFDDMKTELASRRVAVSRETVRRWCEAIGMPTNRVPASVSSSSAGRDQGASTPPEDSLSSVPAGGEISNPQLEGEAVAS